MTYPYRTNRRTRLGLEQLETRQVPATLVSPTTVTYTDADGDQAKVVLSKPLFDSGNVASIFEFDSSFATTGPQQLRTLKLSLLGDAVNGVSLSVSTVENGGDGQVHVGFIDATGVQLKSVTVAGDLGRLQVGKPDTAGPALGKLSVVSMGRFGTDTQAAGGDLRSVIDGNVSVFQVAQDVDQALVEIEGRVNKLTVGGSLIGGDDNDSGNIFAAQGIGKAVIGSILGGGGFRSGALQTGVAADINKLTVVNSVEGGNGFGSGIVSAGGNLGSVRIDRDLVGGDGERSGNIICTNNLTSMLIKGSLFGGSGLGSGRIAALNAIGSVTVAGTIGGGQGTATIIARGIDPDGVRTPLAIGSVHVANGVSELQILAGYDGNANPVNADARIGSVKIDGPWIASSIAAGAAAGADGLFGTFDDIAIVDPNDDPEISSRIGKIFIRDDVVGSDNDFDHFGIVAEQIDAMSFAGLKVPLTDAPNIFELLSAGRNDTTIREI